MTTKQSLAEWVAANPQRADSWIRDLHAQAARQCECAASALARHADGPLDRQVQQDRCRACLARADELVAEAHRAAELLVAEADRIEAAARV